MANTNKMTKKDYFNAIKAMIIACKGENLSTDVNDTITFIDNELELLVKKANRASTKPTKAQAENDTIKAAIIVALDTLNKAVTISELMTREEFAGYSNQKLSALMKQLVDVGKVIKTVEKKKSYFATPVTEDVNEEPEVDVNKEPAEDVTDEDSDT